MNKTFIEHLEGLDKRKLLDENGYPKDVHTDREAADLMAGIALRGFSRIMRNPLHTELPIVWRLPGNMTRNEMNQRMVLAGFNFEPEGCMLMSGSARIIAVVRPHGWEYSPDLHDGLRDPQGQLVAINIELKEPQDRSRDVHVALSDFPRAVFSHPPPTHEEKPKQVIKELVFLKRSRLTEDIPMRQYNG